ncbi:MAG TPA: hypothetical protein VE991_11520 [Acidimicrobiales bacterium]|nr:hypothetical protein [Acidimicrobiales bacterium]
MAATTEFGSLRHLAGRFFGALWPGGPKPADEAWARRWLVPGEQDLWGRMSGPDRRHAVGVARGTLALLGAPAEPDRAVVAAALLHDAGKVEAGFGTLARAVVTALAMVAGRARLAAEPGGGRREGRWRRRIRLYLTHDAVGAELLQAAGSAPVTVAWTREHHRPREQWTVPQPAADALKAADGD